MALETYDLRQTGAEVQRILDSVETIDNVPQPNSQNAVKSGGVYGMIQQSKTEYDEVPVEGSSKAVRSGGLFNTFAAKADAVPVVNHGTSDTTFALTAGVYHVWGDASELNLTLAEDTSSYLYTYMFQFSSGAVPTSLTLPSTILGMDEIEIVSGMVYQIAITNNIARVVSAHLPTEVVSTPFLSRITANGLTLANDRALIRSLHGNTLVWNQKVASSAHMTNIGLTMDYANGVLTVSGTATTSTTIAAYPRFTSVAGHIYYVHLNGTHNFDRLVIGSSGNLPTTLSPIRVTWNATTNAAPNLYVTSGQTYSASFKYYVIDLTAMFGSGNEPTLAEFEALYPLGNYAADAGRLLDFKGETMRSVGFNLWDEEWDLGSIDSNGVLMPGSYFRSKNTIPVLPSTQYYMTRGNNVAWVYFYGANGEYLRPYTTLNVGSGTFTTPAGSYYIRFLVDTSYGTTYKNDICINLSNTSLNGTYKPYSAQDITINPTAMYGYLNGEGEAVQIFPSGMRSAGSVFDTVEKVDGKWYATVNIGNRAYDSTTDDTDTSVTTDKSTTNYLLATTRTYLLTDEWQQILNTAYQVETGGMEIILPENWSEPYTSPACLGIEYTKNI